ncbi:hypothetical protein PYCCODRAFT_405650 [Trametes coccinea BRFM310]|uniref:Uncharacterized protein n=1 Tax=Trametes coccinea (strain BRFM310) TaxID=1353009 RepID=A0A1Y2IMY0_TRAC3|nr:hypothetical protein PYCCODRAFT_405650 [Trametes coccinea BRFM310]
MLSAPPVSHLFLVSLLLSALQVSPVAAAHSSFTTSHARRSLLTKRDSLEALLHARGLGDGLEHMHLLGCARRLPSPTELAELGVSQTRRQVPLCPHSSVPPPSRKLRKRSALRSHHCFTPFAHSVTKPSFR